MQLSDPISRTIVTPVTIVLFVVSTVTGIMLLAHWQAGLVRFSHEWLSIGFSAIALWHLLKNWSMFLNYLRRNGALTAFGLSLAASLVFTGLTGTTSNASPGAVFRAMGNAPLSAAAPAFGLTLEAARERLKAQGIEAADDETIVAIARRAGSYPAVVLTALAGVGTQSGDPAQDQGRGQGGEGRGLGQGLGVGSGAGSGPGK